MQGVFVILTFISASVSRAQEASFWNNQAQETLNTILNQKVNTNVAKNVIFFLGDGMGVSTVTAARIYKGQLKNKTGEEERLTFETFPYSGLIKTYNTDQQVPDSAGTATAFLCGVKSKAGTVGLDDKVEYNNCSSQRGAEVTSILDWSLAEGKSVGIVTTARLTHATPAAAYAHVARRGWEGDMSLTDDIKIDGCKDIAYQLIKNNPDFKVLMGGGRRFFLSNTTTDPELNYTSWYQRKDVDLVEEWIRDKSDRNKTYAYTWNKAQFDAVDPTEVEYLLGLFESSHMQYESDRDQGPEGEPSIAEMTKKAIDILQTNEKGFFLLVEGGRIDHAHHATYGARALLETVAFDNAIETALAATDDKDTLVVVTADHSHVFAIAGYPTRGNDILGLVDDDYDEYGQPFTTLVYGNGPQTYHNLTNVDTTDFSYRQTAAVPLSSETHGGEDVPVYAKGPMAHLFTGTQEQNFIAHAMAYASCVGTNKNHCQDVPSANRANILGSFNYCYFTISICAFLRFLFRNS